MIPRKNFRGIKTRGDAATSKESALESEARLGIPGIELSARSSYLLATSKWSGIRPGPLCSRP